MKKIILKTALLVLIGFSASCKQATPEKTTTTVETIEHSLVLNNGTRWIANSETTKGVAKITQRMHAFSGKNTVADYAILTDDLKGIFLQIFQECTMTGEAHNQLHNFLIPINELFTPLASSDLATCQKSFNALQAHVKQYKIYFN